nr:MAG TPA: hypothetical protein [Bacteriophage sp.]
MHCPERARYLISSSPYQTIKLVLRMIYNTGHSVVHMIRDTMAQDTVHLVLLYHIIQKDK